MDLLLPWLRRTGWAYVAVAVALALISWRLLADGDRVQGTPPDGASVRTVGTGATASPPAARLVVHVTGAVRRPGVYALPEGARVQRAVARAGGPTRVADLGALNLAAQVQDGQQVVVPVRARPGAAAPAGATGTPGAPVSLSRASAEELDGLDGIGPTLAARIVAWRQANGGFASVDQLLEVEGIGPTRLESLRTQVVP